MLLPTRVLIAAAALALAGCSLLDSFTIEIQQGNYVSQEMVSQLKPGMSREQVRFVLGTPLLTDIFHADRWDYVYYRKIPGGKTEERKLAVYFKDGQLARLEGDVVAASEREKFKETGG
ncbi:MAG TPA: outer membrane protein assembly factor BamE [Burkholderiales bacterium]|nr:outer membrane protein assembly factor BamE [Burkholderiales bacterium]